MMRLRRVVGGIYPAFSAWVCVLRAHFLAVPVLEALPEVCNFDAESADAAMMVGAMPVAARGSSTSGPATEFSATEAWQ